MSEGALLSAKSQFQLDLEMGSPNTRAVLGEPPLLTKHPRFDVFISKVRKLWPLASAYFHRGVGCLALDASVHLYQLTNHTYLFFTGQKFL